LKASWPRTRQAIGLEVPARLLQQTDAVLE